MLRPRESHHHVASPSSSEGAQRRLERCAQHGLDFGGDPKFPVNGVVICKSFSAAFTLKHRECKQASARRHGGLLLRLSALRVMVPPASRAPSKKADLGTWE